MNYTLTSRDYLTQLLKDNGISSWDTLLEYVKNLPYGRISNRNNFSLVLTEQKGTCSSKHALLKLLADANQIPNISLVLSLFKMTAQNTPKVKAVLEKHQLPFMPEAHCYLKINGQETDLTAPNFNFKNIEPDILEEVEIKPEQAGDFKVEFHKTYVKNWLQESSSPYTFEKFWAIREQCIEALAT
ncbi:MAG: hypothetical protein R2802_09175 [Flavobacteriaceae bacterium]